MKLKFLQEGGPMEPAAQGGAPAGPEGMPQEGGMEQPQEGQPGGGQIDPAMIDQLAEALIQKLGPDVAMMVADAIMQKVQGGGAAGPQGMAPQEAPQEPVYARRGGKIFRIG